ncbi:MAG: DUF1844 domain-containing protein [Phycisphaerales bacterium]|nr:MAG: DUF1844 domain-containing protein [Phycisphaerales bacterium]
MSDEGSKSRLHIDSDWKTEAAQEKERLAKEETVSAEAGDTGAQAGASGFAELLNMLAMQAAIALGGYQGPGGERIPPNHAAAKHQIDLLEVLDQKTKGNLTDDEKRMLDSVLYELRIQYVQAVGGGAPTPSPGA